MGARGSTRATVTTYEASTLNLTPVAETTQAQICCRNEAMSPNSDFPEAEKYVVRPKGGMCIQAKPRTYNGKIYYVVGMVPATQGKKTSDYINLKLDMAPIGTFIEASQTAQPEIQLIVPNSTVAPQEGAEASTRKTLEQFLVENPSSPDSIQKEVDDLPDLQIVSNPPSAPASNPVSARQPADPSGPPSVRHLVSPAAEPQGFPEAEEIKASGLDEQ